MKKIKSWIQRLPVGNFLAILALGSASVARQPVFAAEASAGYFDPVPSAPVLNVPGFSSCLAAAAAEPSLTLPELRERHGLGLSDGLLPFLAVYPGVRPSSTVSWAQDQAHELWQIRFEAIEALLAEFVASGRGALAPDAVFGRALELCSIWSGDSRSDPLCASILGHNLFRTLGRHERAVYFDKRFQRRVDLNPAWFRLDRERWLVEIEVIRSRLLPLRADGEEKFGEWYHFFGILAYSVRELAVNGNVNAVESAVRWNRRLNPILAGGVEDPEKARLDLDSVRVASRLVFLMLAGTEGDRRWSPDADAFCSAPGAYRVEGPAFRLSLSVP